MKRFLIIFLIITTSNSLKAQFTEGGWCGTAGHTNRIAQEHPEYTQSYNKLEDQISNISDSVSNALKTGTEATVITIPVVFHILHNNWNGNISDAQIKDAVNTINEDFNKTNSDVGQVRNLFKPYIADCEIQFKLAQIDPNGNCTKGITRNNTPLTNDATDACKSVVQWPAKKYLNIWVVNSIGNNGSSGTILGYAQFPGYGPWSTYGVVVRNDCVGPTGFSNRDGRTLTHEIGHCLGLFHTFQSGCGTSCSNTGDQVCDTPPVSQAFFACNNSENSCSNDMNGSGSPYTTDVPDQIENFMAYNSGCTRMFSKGQNTRMHSTISSVAKLQELISNSNLVATGTNSGYTSQNCKPIAEFKWDYDMICEGNNVQYKDKSYNGQVTTWNWIFQGGSPSTSSDSDVVVTYNTNGTYNTELSVSNSSGANNIKKNKIILVSSKNAKYSSYIYHEGFENTNTFGNDWIIINPDGNTQWQRTTATSSSGSASMFIKNMSNNTKGQLDAAISPSIDFTAINQPILTFKLAYAQTKPNDDDKLSVYYSTNCGQTWQLRYTQSGNSLATTPIVTPYFVPRENQWKDIVIPVTFQYASQKNVRVKFEFISGNGNNIYIDDINLISTTGIDKNSLKESSFKIYPNPAKELVNVEFNLLKQTKHVSLTLNDMLGRKVTQICNDATLEKGKQNIKIDLKTLDLPKGFYFIKLETPDGKNSTKKLIIE